MRFASFHIFTRHRDTRLGIVVGLGGLKGIKYVVRLYVQRGRARAWSRGGPARRALVGRPVLASLKLGLILFIWLSTHKATQ